MRLYDLIRNADDLKWRKPVRDSFDKAQVFLVDNVTEYYYAVSDREVWTIPEDFPNLAPPFSSFFLETKRPSCIFSEGVRRNWDTEFARENPNSDLSRPVRWGGWFNIIDKATLPDMLKADPTLALHSLDMHVLMSDACKWVVGILLWVEPPPAAAKFYPAYPNWLWMMGVDAEGKLLEVPSVPKAFGFVSMPGEHVNRGIAAGRLSRDEAHDICTELIGYLKPLFLAISFLHCKNVRQVVQRAPEKLVKKHAKHGRKTLPSYRVLDIKPMRKVLVAAGGETGEAGRKSFHIARGHFKTYTPAKPLLGRAVGTFWWDQQARGSAAAGFTPKDYRIHPPESPS